MNSKASSPLQETCSTWASSKRKYLACTSFVSNTIQSVSFTIEWSICSSSRE